jgi:hypothetical protein
MNKYTYSKEHPLIIAAGQKQQSENLKKFETSKNSKHLYAVVQDFFDWIGHEQLYTKDYFVELKEKLTNENRCFHRINERFVKSKRFMFEITSINCLKNYTDFIIDILDSEGRFECQFKVRIKHQSYFQMRKDVAIAFYQIIKAYHVPNNYIEHENVKNIWEFDFSKIDFLKSK